MRLALVMLGGFGLMGLVVFTVPLTGQDKGKSAKDTKTLVGAFTYPGAEKLATAASAAADGAGIFSAKYQGGSGQESHGPEDPGRVACNPASRAQFLTASVMFVVPVTCRTVSRAAMDWQGM
jgi:hypothetical protein